MKNGFTTIKNHLTYSCEKARKMKTEQFKYVVGEANSGEPAYMRFYGRIDEYSARNFNDEFLWLQDYVKPSKIIISINSEGGSVLHGMGTYSIIQNSPIETETIIEGLAASMASILWAAGTRSLMRDYSILMIHNPFLASDKCKTQDKCKPQDGCKPEDGCKPKCKCKPKCEDDDNEDDDDNSQMIEAFRKQIETIYTKRFGLSQDKVREIMEGKKGCDGTYFDAKQAVKAGIIPAANVIKTSKQVCTKVKNQIEGLVEASQIQEMMASINAELCGIKPLEIASSIPNQNQIQNSNSQVKMEKEQEIAFGSVCAQLGLETTAGIADVVNSINALKETAKKLTDIQGAYDALKIQKEGLDAQLTNVKDELTTVKAELQTYKDAEKAQHDAEIAQFIDAAIADGKIKAEAKSMWVEMAQNHFDVVKNTLNSIDKQEKISEKIAGDPANVQDAANGMTEAEKRMQAAVAEIVGEDFQFNKLD